jgi:hypothetical protein
MRRRQNINLRVAVQIILTKLSRGKVFFLMKFIYLLAAFTAAFPAGSDLNVVPAVTKKLAKVIPESISTHSGSSSLSSIEEVVQPRRYLMPDFYRTQHIIKPEKPSSLPIKKKALRSIKL